MITVPGALPLIPIYIWQEYGIVTEIVSTPSERPYSGSKHCFEYQLSLSTSLDFGTDPAFFSTCIDAVCLAPIIRDGRNPRPGMLVSEMFCFRIFITVHA